MTSTLWPNWHWLTHRRRNYRRHNWNCHRGTQHLKWDWKVHNFYTDNVTETWLTSLVQLLKKGLALLHKGFGRRWLPDRTQRGRLQRFMDRLTQDIRPVGNGVSSSSKGARNRNKKKSPLSKLQLFLIKTTDLKPKHTDTKHSIIHKKQTTAKDMSILTSKHLWH